METDMEVYASFECTARLYFKAQQRPVEHRCRLTLGGACQQGTAAAAVGPCLLVLEGKACQRRTFRVTKENVTKVVARLGDGSMTVVFQHGPCDSLVVKEVIDRGALTRCHKIISGITMGLADMVTAQGPANGGLFSSPVSGREVPTQTVGERSISAVNRRKIELTLKKRYGDTHGSRMLEAAQNKTAKASSFYKVDSSAVEPFLPQTPPTISPYFQRSGKRSLTLELSNEHHDGGVSRVPSPRGRPGPRKEAVIAKKRLPLGDICTQPPGGAPEVKDCLTMNEQASREGFANLGNTCYMNAVLQALLGLEPFAEDLLNQQLLRSVGPRSLCRMMYLLLKSKRAKDSYESQRVLLKKIKSVIESSRPKFSGYRQQDAHELLTQCLDQLKDDSKSITTASSDDRQSKVPSVCPVIRNFECEVCRSITCKRCGKVTEVSEVIYDFALQLPKSVIARPNEQANLQDLLEKFFNSEEVEYKCPACSYNTATMSCRMARLPRVMIIFLKRYGYNTNLSRNSKRVDFIRIPRFISVGNFCSESTTPPCTYEGPWPRSLENPSSDNKENFNFPSSSSTSTATEGTDQLPPRENFPAEPGQLCSAVGSVDGRVPGKRRSSESVVQDRVMEPGEGEIAVKKQRLDEVSVSVDSRVQPTTTGPVVSCSTSLQTYTSVSSSNVSLRNCFPMGSSDFNTCGSNSNTVVSSSQCAVSRQDDSVSTCVSSNGQQNSVGRDIVAEFDSLFSPEVLLQLDKDPQLTALPSTDPSTVTDSTNCSSTRDSVATHTDSGASCCGDMSITTTSTVASQPTNTLVSLADAITHSSITVQSEHPLTHVSHKEMGSSEECSMLGLFGGVSSEGESRRSGTSGERGGTPATVAAVTAQLKNEEDEEDLGLQRAMEESIRDQSSDVALLHRMGLSEEEQLKLALELSMQEQCVEECPMDQQLSCAEPEVPTPDSHRPETYKLMGIVNHIGKASSGGHYISDVCSVREGVWRSYNDSYVMETREEDIRQKRKGTGYIFFYMHKSVIGSINGRTT